MGILLFPGNRKLRKKYVCRFSGSERQILKHVVRTKLLGPQSTRLVWSKEHENGG